MLGREGEDGFIPKEAAEGSSGRKVGADGTVTGQQLSNQKHNAGHAYIHYS